MFSDYQSVLDYLYDLLPMYQRVGSIAYKKNLDNIIALCDVLGNPQEKFDTIHVGGTNGKGSCSHMLASVLQSSGCHTGLYTSPHLKRFTERIRIDGVEVEEEFVVNFVNDIQNEIERIKPSFFELTVAMAFEYFAKQEVDIAVIEVGLGGRLDSTNIIHPEVCLITNIGLEHTDMLGDTLEQIAYEKAGIIKPKVPVVIGEFQDETEPVFTEKAIEEDAPIYYASEEIQFTNVRQDRDRVLFDLYKGQKLRFKDLHTDLTGSYQLKNIPGVIKVLELLPGSKYQITEKELRLGLANVKHNTGLKGRWQILKDKPFVVCDVAHNENGIDNLLSNLAFKEYDKLYIIWGMVKGKDERKIFKKLPRDAFYCFSEADIPRKLPAEDLFNTAKNEGFNGKVILNVNDAIRDALKQAKEKDCILIAGSNFLIAEIENL